MRVEKTYCWWLAAKRYWNPSADTRAGVVHSQSVVSNGCVVDVNTPSLDRGLSKELKIQISQSVSHDIRVLIGILAGLKIE